MKRIARYALLFALALLLLGACSRKGVHMSKHRKSRRCNCPTFGMAAPATEPALAVNYTAQ